MLSRGECLGRYARAAKRTRIGSNRRRTRPRSNRHAVQVHDARRPRYTKSNLWALPSLSPCPFASASPGGGLAVRKISAARRQDIALACSLCLRNGEVSDDLDQDAPSSDSAKRDTRCSRAISSPHDSSRSGRRWRSSTRSRSNRLSRGPRCPRRRGSGATEEVRLLKRATALLWPSLVLSTVYCDINATSPTQNADR
jgi:hypothetical protein